MSEPTDTTTIPAEPKPETPATEAHAPAESAVAETVPQAEASVEKATEPDPAPSAPPELAEPVAVEAAAASGEETEVPQSEELVPVQPPESEALVPVHDAVVGAASGALVAGGEAESAAEEPAGEEPKAEEEAPAPKPKKPRTKKAAVAAATAADTADEPTGTVDAATPATPPENKKKWYAIKVQSGREDTIKSAILRKVAIEGLEEFFGRIEIPVEEEIVKKTVRVKDKKTGDYTTQEKKVTRKKKKFQGYLFAELEFNDRILYLFRETSGVGDFLNLRGTPPVPEPMPEHEVESMLTGVAVRDPSKKGGKVKVKLDFEKGDRVRVREDSFAGQEGEVKAITEPKDPTDTPKITVILTFWGRPLEVELDYWKVEKV